MYYDEDNGLVRAWVYSEEGYNDYSFPLTLSLEEWYHIVLVYDNAAAAGSKMKLFMNGYSISGSGTEDGSGIVVTAPSTLSFTISDFRAYCAMDDIMIFQSALPASAVDALYNGGAGVESSAPITVPSSGGSRYFYHSNTLYSVYALTDASGAIIERYAYDPYGRAFIYDAGNNQLTASAIANPYTFTGQRLDSETGLMYYRNRYYDMASGKFISRDPIFNADICNTYFYANNNPLLYIDDLGEDVKSPDNKNDDDWKKAREKEWERINKERNPKVVVCLFSYSRSEISCSSDNKSWQTCKAFSGDDECRNKPEKQDVPLKGPLPKGEWIIGKCKMSDTLAVDWCNLYFKQPSGKYENTNIGPKKRGNMGLHPGQISHGCCTVDYKNKENEPYPNDRNQGSKCWDKLKALFEKNPLTHNGTPGYSGFLIVVD